MSTAHLVRTTVATSLVLGAVLAVISVLLMPDFSGGHAERLTAIAGAQATSTVSALAFTSSQLFLAVGLAGVALLLRSRVPVLAGAAATLAVLGAFGHAVYGGVNMVMLSMAQDPAGLQTHAEVLARAEQGAGLPFMVMGLLGTVLGFVLLGVALWRARLGPRWLGPAVVVWVVVEFVGSGLTQWAAYASGLLYTAIFGMLAVLVWRSSITHWQTAAEAAQPADERVTA